MVLLPAISAYKCLQLSTVKARTTVDTELVFPSTLACAVATQYMPIICHLKFLAFNSCVSLVAGLVIKVAALSFNPKQ